MLLYIPDRSPSSLAYWETLEEPEAGARAQAATEAALFQFHSAQFDVFRSKARVRVIVAGRRWGKSEVIVRLVAFEAHKRRHLGGVIWVILPTYSMARPIWRKFMRLCPPGWITGMKGTETQPDYLEFGAVRVEFKSADRPERLVGEGPLGVAVDESGIVVERVWKESIQPALLDHRGWALLTGTPKGKGTWFWEMYARGLDPLDPSVATFGGPTMENPFLDPEEVERLKGEMPQRLFEQEILARFLDDEGAVFRGVRDLVGDYSTDPTVAYGVDLARKRDFTVVIGLDKNRRVTFFDRFREVSWPVQKDRILAAIQHPRCGGRRPRVIIDATGVGDPVVQDLQRAGARVEGFVFTAASKLQLVDALVMACEQRRIVLPDEPVLVNELQAFEFTVSKTGAMRYSAPEGLHDDCVMSLALASKAAERAGDTGISIGPAPQVSEVPPVLETVVPRPWYEVNR